MTDDGDARVRYQLAFSLGEFAGPDRDAALARLVRRDAAEPLMRTAIFSSLFRGAGNVLVALLGDDAARRSQPVRAIVEQLAAQIGQQANAAELALLEQALAPLPDSDAAVTAVVRGLVAGRSKAAPAARQNAVPGPRVSAILRTCSRRRTSGPWTRRSRWRAESTRCERFAWARMRRLRKRSLRCWTIGIRKKFKLPCWKRLANSTIRRSAKS